MADENPLERTEPASPRRLEQAREEGQVARSQELTTFAVLAAAAGGVWIAGGHVISRLSSVMRDGLEFPRAAVSDPRAMLDRLAGLGLEGLIALAPLALIVFLAALAAPLLVNGWLFRLNVLAPDFDRLDPIRGLARMFSVRSALELAKAAAKAIVIGGVAAAVVWHYRDTLLGLSLQPFRGAMAELGAVMGISFAAIVGTMMVVAAIDVPFQLWDHHRKLRMTRDEVRREAKETEGDPQIKARVRSLQREAARKRMMAAVPKADVVVTNPAHYAVALHYDGESMRAPRVVAKGAHLLAARIRELAEAHRVPVLEAPPLARALYRRAEVGDEIPEALYTAVAQVLAYIYELRRHQTFGGAAPRAPLALAVPGELDPQARMP